MRVDFPDILAIDQWLVGSPIRQVAQRGVAAEGSLIPLTRGKRKGFLFKPDDGGAEIIVAPDEKFVQAGATHM